MRTVLAVCLAAAFMAGCANHGASPVIPGGVPSNPEAVHGSTVSLAGFAKGVPAQSLGPVRFVVALPLRNELELDGVLAAISDPDSPQYRHFITPEAFDARYAPSAADLAAVAIDLRGAGFAVSLTDQAVLAGGTQAQAERYFGTRFAGTPDSGLVPRKALAYPSALALRHAKVIGLDGPFHMHTYSRIVPATVHVSPDNAFGLLGPYFPVDLKQAYQMPSIQDANGKGVTIGIVIDAPVVASDIKKFFSLFGSAEPKVTIVKVDGGSTSTTDIGEATLDVEQSGGIAPGAHIIVYEFPTLQSGQDIYNAYAAAIAGKEATLVNSSFGGCENIGTSNLSAFDSLFKKGIAGGITFVASSGDHGADSCGSNSNALGVSWPAVSPYVLAVGGTNLVTAFAKGSNNAAYTRESADKDIKPSNGVGNYWGSGGGYSTNYTRPSWQAGFVSKNARGVPDVSGHMGGLGFSGVGSGGCQAEKCSPDDSSDVEYVQGRESLAIGTSASSPDTVGLLALATELAKSPLGDVHALLYKEAKTQGLFHRGIPGNNGYPTTKGIWDPVLGLGTPDAAYKLLGAKTPAGIPGSSTNP